MMGQDAQRAILFGGWFIANFIGVGLIVFAHALALRVIGWLWVSFAISLSGLVSIGLISYERFKKG